MHRYPLTLLLVVIAATSAVPAAAASAAQTRISELEQQLANTEQQRNELARQLESSLAERDSAQAALQQQNQKLKLQAGEALSRQTQSPLNEQQTWYLIGAATALLGVLLGTLLRGRRKQRREWLN